MAKMLKAIHAQESKKAAREKARAVIAELREMKLKEAAKKVEAGIKETLTCCDFPSEHWTRIRTNNVIERLEREIRRRTRVVGTFPDGNSALMLVCARLRHVAGTQWGNRKYMNMKHLEAALGDPLLCITTLFFHCLQTILRIKVDGTHESGKSALVDRLILWKLDVESLLQLIVKTDSKAGRKCQRSLSGSTSSLTPMVLLTSIPDRRHICGRIGEKNKTVQKRFKSHF